MICCWIDNPNSDAYKLHLPRIYDYLWVAEDGMKAQVIPILLFLYIFLLPFSRGYLSKNVLDLYRV